MIKNFNQKIFYYFIPFLVGCITSFSLPPYNLIFINFFTFPIFLFILIKAQNESAWLNFKIGWLFGIGYFLSNIYWITHSLTFEEIFKPLIPFALILIPSFLGLFYGFITLIASRFKLKQNFKSIFIFSLLFSVLEFIRGNIFGGFPWNLIVYSWTNYLNSLQILSLIGTYSFNLISLTLFLSPLLIVFKKKMKWKIFSLIFLFFVLACNHFYGSWKIKNDKKFYTEFQNFKVKIISPKISIDRFFKYKSEEVIINELIELSNPNILKETIFIFPEGIFPGINLNGLQNFEKKFSKKFSNKDTIILGINTDKIEENSTKIFNSMVVLDNKLNLLNEYKKNKLVPFGEFLPMEKFLKKIGLKKITKGYKSFSSGLTRELIFISNKDFSFVPLICYEIIYSGKITKLNDSNFIINISEDGWFGNSIGPHQHFAHSIFRAIEEGKNIFRSSNNGISAYIDANGVVINKIGTTQKGVIEINNYKKLQKTLFSKFGNKIFFYFILIYISLIFFIYKRER